jgi:ferric-dicitrate binding protein FerR (iron transport regulator)
MPQLRRRPTSVPRSNFCGPQEHRRAYEEIEETILRMRRIPALPPLPTRQEMAADAYDGSVPIREFLEEPRPRSVPARVVSGRKRSYFALAASLAALCVLCGWLWLAGESRFGQFTYATPAGERQEFTLPDGSKITLDAGSMLSADLTSTERVMRLEQGEAYFQVAKDRDRPFIVRAGGARVRARYGIQRAHGRQPDRRRGRGGQGRGNFEITVGAGRANGPAKFPHVPDVGDREARREWQQQNTIGD